MFEALRRHTTTIAVAMVTAAVTAGGPALAAAVQEGLNADQVDGKHAVGAGATVAQRSGKLVATNASGRLPNNIIAKAPDANTLDGINSTGFLRTGAKAADANKLDGRDSADFAPATLKSGTVVSGVYAAYGTGPGGYIGGAVQYPIQPATAISGSNIHYASGSPTEACPGVGDAAAGHVCMYPSELGSATFAFTYQAATSGKTGFFYYANATGSGPFMTGTWTMRAP